MCIRTNCRARLRDSGTEIAIELKPADVVDDDGSGRYRLARHARFVGIDGDGETARGQPLDDRQHAAQFFVCRKRLGARPRRFSPDVEDVRAFLDHAQAILNRTSGIEPHTPIRKGVRRDVENPHDEGTLAQHKCRTIGSGTS